MSPLRRVVSAIVAMVAVAAGITFSGSAAHAALPYCNNVSMIYKNDSDGHFVLSPTYAPSPYNPSYPPTTSCDMAGLHENGTTGERQAIQLIQLSIKYCYLINVSVDGSYGPQTRNAVMQVQTRLGFTGSQVDGWAGPNTRSRMQMWGLDNANACAVARIPSSYYPWDREPTWGVPGEFQYYPSLQHTVTSSRLLGPPTRTRTCSLSGLVIDVACETEFVGPLAPGNGAYVSIFTSAPCDIDYTVTRAYIWFDGYLFEDIYSARVQVLNKGVTVLPTAFHAGQTVGLRLTIKKANILKICDAWGTIAGSGPQ